jgi:GntR family transcriptional regulator, transcriptional repressor for pyruvate dehydrogenase complex
VWSNVDNDETGWNTVGAGSLNERIRLEILRALQSQDLKPGDRLPSERELAINLHVSRPSVREAVKSLEAEGRLVVKHGQGVFVAEPSVRKTLRASLANLDHSLAELFAMREILEVPAARWAAQRGDPLALQRIQEAFDALEKASQEQPVDFDRLQELDATFHLRIVEAAGNRLLVQSQGVLNELLETGMQTTLAIPGRMEKSRGEHRLILDGIIAGDPVAASRAARTHIHRAGRAATRRNATVNSQFE